MPDFDLCTSIMTYEEGHMPEEEVTDFFQALVNSGLAWSLQEAYGRKAWSMIDAGEISLPESKP